MKFFIIPLIAFMLSFQAFATVRGIQSTQRKMRSLEISTKVGVSEILETFQHVTLSATNDVNATTDTFSSTAHGFVSGDKVRITSEGTIPGGTNADTDYYIIYVTADTFKLATTRTISLTGTPILNLTSVGTTAHVIALNEMKVTAHGLIDNERIQISAVAAEKAAVTFSSTTDISAAADEFNNGVVHGFITGDRVQVTTTVTLPTGLSASTDYWVYASSTATLSLASTLEAATFGATMVNITTTGSGDQTITISATLPTGISASTDYWVDKIDSNRFNLRTTFNDALPLEWTDASAETPPIGTITMKRTDELNGLAKYQVTITASETGMYQITPDVAFGSDANVHVQVTPTQTDCIPSIVSKATNLIVIQTSDGSDGTTKKDCYFDAFIYGSDIEDNY
ncbi:MAG: hypothetical protein KAJ40_00560 [Alphaproteobacteria bacterium]|nr:hypothetical protein [Alphaproteobacteria bacterium]